MNTVLNLHFLGSTHFPNEGQKTKKGEVIERHKKNITILRTTKSDAKRNNVIQYIFAGPSYLDIGTLTIKNITAKAINYATKEIDNFLNSKTSDEDKIKYITNQLQYAIKTEMKRLKLDEPENIEKTETAITKAVQDIFREIKKSENDTNITINMSGCSRSGAIAESVFKKLQSKYNKNNNVKFNSVDKAEEYSGPINRRFTKDKDYKDIYEKKTDESPNPESRIVVLSVDTEYISNRLFRSIAYDKQADIFIVTLKNHRDCIETIKNFKKQFPNEKSGMYFENKKIEQITSKDKHNEMLKVILDNMNIKIPENKTQDTQYMSDCVCKKLTSRRREIFKWAKEKFLNSH